MGHMFCLSGKSQILNVKLSTNENKNRVMCMHVFWAGSFKFMCAWKMCCGIAWTFMTTNMNDFLVIEL